MALKIRELAGNGRLTRVFFSFTVALSSVLVQSRANATWKVIEGGRQPSKGETSACDRYLTPDFSIFPLHRHLFRAYARFSRELHMKSFTISMDRFAPRVTVEMTFPGPQVYAVVFDVDSAAHQLTLNSTDGTLVELVYGQVHRVIYFENEPWPAEDLNYFKDILTLATALAIPAVLPKEQDVTVRLEHRTASNLGGGLETSITRELARYSHQHILEKPDLLIHRLPTYHVFASLGFTQYAQPPILRPMLERPPANEFDDEFSAYDYDYDVVLKFSK